MTRPRVVGAGFLLVLAGSVWQIVSLQKRVTGLEQENDRLRADVHEASQGRPALMPVTTASVSGDGARAPARSRRPESPHLDGTASPELLPNGLIVIGKGTASETTLTPEEAAKLSSGLLRAAADAANKGPGGASYSAGKATGAPDGANHGGDTSNAWCPRDQTGANEWLQLKYAKNVEISEVNIHETYATGALAKVSAIMPDGSERVIWQGREPVETPPVERVVKVPPGIRADQLRLTMDGSRIGNWQEIDAVEIVGRDGSRQWASEATASSYWGSRDADFGMNSRSKSSRW
jgi:hypothetical protein